MHQECVLVFSWGAFSRHSSIYYNLNGACGLVLVLLNIPPRGGLDITRHCSRCCCWRIMCHRFLVPRRSRKEPVLHKYNNNKPHHHHSWIYGHQQQLQWEMWGKLWEIIILIPTLVAQVDRTSSGRVPGFCARRYNVVHSAGHILVRKCCPTLLYR